MQFPTLLVAIIGAASSAMAYGNNCNGSGVGIGTGTLADCHVGISRIIHTVNYSDGAEFSAGHCYIKYATNGSGAQPVSGEVIAATANAILQDCGPNGRGAPNFGRSEGSFGTGNCSKCHVTINYRS